MSSETARPAGQPVLIAIRDYLESRNQASMRDLSSHFRLQPDALRGMLDHWIRKGRVARYDFASECGCGSGSSCASSCTACGVEASFEIYEWKGITESA